VERLRATYRLRVGADAVQERATALCLEQTVELPRRAVRDPVVEREILPEIEELAPDGPEHHRVEVAYPAATAAGDPAQLLNVLFGNASLQDDVELTAVALPESLRRALGGPRHGAAGLREAAGVPDRPLTATALKPMGLAPEALAQLAATFARAGVDVIKDDHGLADHAFCPFPERVSACLAAVDRVADETGHRALYAPNLMGPPDALARQLDFAVKAGARAVLVAPMLVGMPAFHALVRGGAPVVLAHPAFAGALRAAPEALVGTLFRAFGADAVIFPHWGGRFAWDAPTCRRVADALRCPWPELRPALPFPAGGIAVERVAEIVDFYGGDAALLVGGSLYAEEGALEARSRAFVDAVRGAVSGEEGAA